MALDTSWTTRPVASCPACGYPTVNAALCAICSPLAVSFGFTGGSTPVTAAGGVSTVHRSEIDPSLTTAASNPAIATAPVLGSTRCQMR